MWAVYTHLRWILCQIFIFTYQYLYFIYYAKYLYWSHSLWDFELTEVSKLEKFRPWTLFGSQYYTLLLQAVDESVLITETIQFHVHYELINYVIIFWNCVTFISKFYELRNNLKNRNCVLDTKPQFYWLYYSNLNTLKFFK